MKKEYFKPEVQTIELETSVLATSGKPEIGGGGANKPITPLSNNNRGEWGNVWQ